MPSPPRQFANLRGQGGETFRDAFARPLAQNAKPGTRDDAQYIRAVFRGQLIIAATQIGKMIVVQPLEESFAFGYFLRVKRRRLFFNLYKNVVQV